MRDKTKKRLKTFISIMAALLLWQIAAMLLNQKLLLVTPIEVIIRLFTIWKEPKFFESIWFSFSRITLGFTLALTSGTLLAIMAARFEWLEVILKPYVVTIKTVPVASFIIISLIWLSSATLSIFISFLMVFPIIYTNVLEGIKSTDEKMLEMAKMYNLSWTKRVRYLFIPQLKPYVLSALKIAIGMSWKSGVAAEVIGIPEGSIGEMLYQAKIYLESDNLFAWTVVIVAVSVIFEKVVVLLVKKLFNSLEGGKV